MDRDGVNEWRKKLKPFNDDVTKATDEWEEAVGKKSAQRKIGQTLTNLRFKIIDELKENREVFTQEQYDTVKPKDMSMKIPSGVQGSLTQSFRSLR